MRKLAQRMIVVCDLDHQAAARFNQGGQAGDHHSRIRHVGKDTYANDYVRTADGKQFRAGNVQLVEGNPADLRIGDVRSGGCQHCSREVDQYQFGFGVEVLHGKTAIATPDVNNPVWHPTAQKLPYSGAAKVLDGVW